MDRTRWAITYDWLRRDILLGLAVMCYDPDFLESSIRGVEADQLDRS
jgi:hypothetical protein